MSEEWKAIKNWEDYYEISNKGYVKSLKRNTIFKDGRIRVFKENIYEGSLSDTGYLYINLTSNSRIKERYFIHKLVAIHFIPNPFNYPIINHKDGIKTNNKVDNLEWCTYSYNQIHAITNGLFKIHTQKINKDIASQIREEYSKGGITQKLLGEKYGLARENINQLINFKQWK